tara:strand:+ start:759 stop:941 length:183 start_codon:yes stop_codon:yes gene_type:complete
MLDANKDKLICETDMFKILQNLSSVKMIHLLQKDFIIVIKNINDARKKEGKDNHHHLIHR